MSMTNAAVVSKDAPNKHMIRLTRLTIVPYKNLHQCVSKKKLAVPKNVLLLTMDSKFSFVYFLVQNVQRVLQPRQQHSVHYQSQ